MGIDSSSSIVALSSAVFSNVVLDSPDVCLQLMQLIKKINPNICDVLINYGKINQEQNKIELKLQQMLFEAKSELQSTKRHFSGFISLVRMSICRFGISLQTKKSLILVFYHFQNKEKKRLKPCSNQTKKLLAGLSLPQLGEAQQPSGPVH